MSIRSGMHLVEGRLVLRLAHPSLLCHLSRRRAAALLDVFLVAAAVFSAARFSRTCRQYSRSSSTKTLADLTLLIPCMEVLTFTLCGDDGHRVLEQQ